jgi:2-methylisocitrate lyase-like PEP mutase family enzyme
MSMNWRDVLATEKPLLLPCAHDGLSARLIADAGFKAYSIGGFPLVGARYGLPDIGLVGLAEMANGVRDIVTASTLPVLVDADDGYGDAKCVARTVRMYESLGVAALFIEDQVSPKRCGHMAGKKVIPMQAMAAKVRAAVAARTNADTFIIARTDARAVHGLDDALRRAESYLQVGADGIFVEAPQSLEELALIGRSFDVPQLANMLEDGDTPMLSPAELAELGFAMVAYPTSLIFRIAHGMQEALQAMRSGQLTDSPPALGFEAYKRIVGFDQWAELEERGNDPVR